MARALEDERPVVVAWDNASEPSSVLTRELDIAAQAQAPRQEVSRHPGPAPSVSRVRYTSD